MELTATWVGLLAIRRAWLVIGMLTFLVPLSFLGQIILYPARRVRVFLLDASLIHERPLFTQISVILGTVFILVVVIPITWRLLNRVRIQVGLRNIIAKADLTLDLQHPLFKEVLYIGWQLREVLRIRHA